MEMQKKHLILGIIVILLVGILLEIIIFNNYQNQFQKSVEKNIKSLVIVKFKYNDTINVPICTGFIIDKLGYIITAKHCYDEKVKEYQQFSEKTITINEIINYGGNIEFTEEGKKIPIKIHNIENLGLNRKDILLLKIENITNLNLIPIEIANIKEVKRGEEIGFFGYFPIENPTINNFANYPLFIGKGILSNLKTDLPNQTESFYTVNAIAAGGYSGGPVFLSKNGKVIGIIKGGIDNNLGLVFVPPIHEIKQIIEDIENK